MIPIICIVGYSGSGKTTLVGKLLPEIIKRGYQVATIKHAKEIHMDPGKDSSLHLAAGSSATALVSGSQLIAMKSYEKAVDLADVMQFLGDGYDIIICEGFKWSNVPKILVSSHRIDRPPGDITGLFAEVNDGSSTNKVPQFGPDDIVELANLIVEMFLKDKERVYKPLRENSELTTTK